MMQFHDGRFNQQLMLCRTLIQSKWLHLFPTFKAGTALPLVKFFLCFVESRCDLEKAIAVLSYSHVPSESGGARTGTCIFYMPRNCSI